MKLHVINEMIDGHESIEKVTLWLSVVSKKLDQMTFLVLKVTDHWLKLKRKYLCVHTWMYTCLSTHTSCQSHLAEIVLFVLFHAHVPIIGAVLAPNRLNAFWCLPCLFVGFQLNLELGKHGNTFILDRVIVVFNTCFCI